MILLPSYHTNLTKRLIKAPKLYFLDTGFCAFLTGWTSPGTLRAGAMNGALVETYAITEVLKSWWFQALEVPMYYYRDRDGLEIDLLIEKDNTLYPIEVKSAAGVRRAWGDAHGSYGVSFSRNIPGVNPVSWRNLRIKLETFR